MTKLFYSYFDKLADKNICCCSFYGLVTDAYKNSCYGNKFLENEQSKVTPTQTK